MFSPRPRACPAEFENFQEAVQTFALGLTCTVVQAIFYSEAHVLPRKAMCLVTTPLQIIEAKDLGNQGSGKARALGNARSQAHQVAISSLVPQYPSFRLHTASTLSVTNTLACANVCGILTCVSRPLSPCCRLVLANMKQTRVWRQGSTRMSARAKPSLQVLSHITTHQIKPPGPPSYLPIPL